MNFNENESRDKSPNGTKTDNDYNRTNSDQESESQKGEKPKNRGVSPDLYSHMTESELKNKLKDLEDQIPYFFSEVRVGYELKIVGYYDVRL